MNNLLVSVRRSGGSWHAAVPALLTLGLTAIHHAYGAFAFGTTWRLHVVYLAVPVAIAILGALWLASSSQGRTKRLATWCAVTVILVAPVAGIGLFEGLYNHVLKNVVYFGFGRETALAMFPPPLYEMPDDFLFELTGVAQFPLSMLAAVRALAWLQEMRRGIIHPL